MARTPDSRRLILGSMASREFGLGLKFTVDLLATLAILPATSMLSPCPASVLVDLPDPSDKGTLPVIHPAGPVRSA